MVERNSLNGASLNGRMTMARATGREFDGDQQLCMTVKKADVFHSETHSDCEIWEPVGHCCVPLKQKEDKQGQGQNGQSGGGQSGGGSEDMAKWNHDQPKGEAAEIMFNYLGSRSHAIGMVTDRRVKPYQLKAGTGATYAPDGSEQMLYFKQNGAYLVSLDGKSVEKPDGNDTRMASLRHVTKEMQSHKIEEKQQGGQQQQQQEYKHEGKSVNTEVRVIKDRIEFRAGEKVVGYYEVSSDTWYFTGKLIHNNATEQMKDTAKKIDRAVETTDSTMAAAIHHN